MPQEVINEIQGTGNIRNEKKSQYERIYFIQDDSWEFPRCLDTAMIDPSPGERNGIALRGKLFKDFRCDFNSCWWHDEELTQEKKWTLGDSPRSHDPSRYEEAVYVCVCVCVWCVCVCVRL